MGETGTINFTRLDRDRKGDGIARCRVRCLDGKLRQVETYGPSKTQAIVNLLERAQQISGDHAPNIGPNTPLTEAVTAWLEEREQADDLRPTSLNLYRHTLTDLDPTNGGIGALTIRECTPGRVQGWIRDMATQHPAKAKRTRVVLAGAFGLARRHGALEGKASPLDGLTLPKVARTPVRAATVDEVHEIRKRARNWVAGLDRPKGGKPRSANTIAIVDVLAATGARIGEVLAIRRADIDLTVRPTRITINGTLVPDGGGWTRQAVTKTDAGWRTVAVPEWCRQSLLQAIAAAPHNPDGLIFPSEAGTPLSPSNVRRRWRALRGDDLAWCTPKSLRKAVATALADEYGADAAASQLGHASSGVTRTHYIERASVAGDFTATLDAFGNETAG